MDHSTLPYPVIVLERRIVKRRNATATQWLIHWSDASPDEAIWEFSEDIKVQFLEFHP